jgi:AcrR family transcriptional regulator
MSETKIHKTGFKRARQPAQKAQRRQAVLAAAAALLEESGLKSAGLEAVNLAAIARRAGVVKSNLYRYFESREEILVRLLVADMEEMCACLERDAALRAGLGKNDLALIAKVMAAEFSRRPRLCLLTSGLASTLERNISEDMLVEIKGDIMAAGQRMINALHAAAPALGPEACTAAGHTIFALVAGLWPMANPAPPVQAAMARLDMESFHGHFIRDLEVAIHALLAGHLALRGK